MVKYLLKRILVIPPLLLGVVTVTFLITRLVPANPLATVLNPRSLGDPAIVAAAKAHWGLNGSIFQQYLSYLGNLVHGDMGTSFVTKNSVGYDIALRLPYTLELVLCAMVIGIIGGIGIGVLAAVRQNTWTDAIGRLFTLLGSSSPQFWSGLVLLLVLSTRLHLLPGPGQLYATAYAPHRITGFYVIDALLGGNPTLAWQAIEHLILPAFILGWGIMGSIARIVRSSMLDVLDQDFVRTGRAKGVREFTVVTKHALRNALLPALTIIGFSFAYLLSADVLVEDIFQWGGLGSYAVTAAESLDYPAIMGVTIVGAIAFLAASLLTDIAYAVADPKIRLG
jgi:ABC-type dipeptide/oligopeptide/nickel transport system permease component